jgi:copper chaperone
VRTLEVAIVEGAMERTVPVQNIHCKHCVNAIQREVADLPGVRSVRADAATGSVTVAWEDPATWTQIVALLQEIGYPPAE